MSTTDATLAVPEAATGDGSAVLDRRRWWALAVIAIAQLMVVLDASIVTIALPSAQRSLHISTADRQWMITAYTLAFGGLLLLGGRIADYVGRKRIFVVGLIGFAAASALGGAAQTAGMLFASRALQGAFAALMAPAALSLISVTFTEPKERAKAFGVYGGVAGGGAAIGLIAGGMLTQFASWRWCLLVNVPIAVLTALAALSLVHESRAHGNTRYDIPGAATITGGLVALVYGFTEATQSGWSSPVTVACLAVAVILMAAFVVIESISNNPLLPIRVLLDRNRGGSFLGMLLAGLGMFGMFLFLSYYMQGTLHYSPLKSGFAFLPFSGGVIVAAGFASKLLPRFGPRVLMGGGFLAGALGMGWLTQIGVHSSWAAHVLPSEIVMSLGLGFAFVSLSSTALVGVDEHDAGVASAVLNSAQQVGASLGTALLNTIAASATAAYIVGHGAAPTALAAGQVHGYTIGFAVSTVVLAIASLSCFALIRKTKQSVPELEEADEEPAEMELAAIGA